MGWKKCVRTKFYRRDAVTILGKKVKIQLHKRRGVVFGWQRLV